MKQIRYTAIIVFIVVLSSCGSNSDDNLSAQLFDQNQGSNITQKETIETPDDLIMSDHYAGEIVVYFDNKASIPLTPFNKGGSEAGGFEGVIFERYSTDPEDVLDKRRALLQELSGIELQDWNLVYRLRIEDKNEAVEIYNKLLSTPGVEKVFPVTDRPLLAASSSTTPDLSGQQVYLKSDLFGGLNAEYAWTLGVHGKDVIIADAESSWNYLHEDLQPVTENGKKWYGDGPCPVDDPSKWKHPINGRCEGEIAHGTSMASILNAAHTSKEFGLKGFAKDSKLYVTADVGNNLRSYYELPGSVVVIEFGTTGKDSPTSSTGYGYDSANQKGQMPAEFLPLEFESIKEAVANGVTVIEGAGNGTVNLDDPSQYEGKWAQGYMNLSKEDSGAIVVGASQGANMQKASWSNWGKRVNAFAWGAGVVSASYPYGDPKDSPYYWSGSSGPPNKNNNEFYTNRSGGTSAATAMVAGAAALTQSYFKQIAGEGMLRYLMPQKIKEFLYNSGIKQKDSTGNYIGVQPRIDEMFKYVDNFWITMKNKYPELTTNRMMTKQRLIEMRKDGIGVICLKQFKQLPITYFSDSFLKNETVDWSLWGVKGSSSLCPEEVMWPKGEKIAVDMDIDGDGISDIISWARGLWKIDLSSRGSTRGTATDYNGILISTFKQDNFGEWDLIIRYSDTAGKWVLPYVQDMDSDTRADLMLYEKDTGKWYVAHTDMEMIAEGSVQRQMKSWDRIIQYDWKDSLDIDPWKSKYSRPSAGNIDSDTKWADISITTSDGYWMIDSGGPNGPDGKWDKSHRYLTDAQLRAAPGWAYNTADFWGMLYVRVPDTLQDEGKLFAFSEYSLRSGGEDYLKDINARFGDSSKIFIPHFRTVGAPISLFDAGENWDVAFVLQDFSLIWQNPASYPSVPTAVGCKPLISDFDGLRDKVSTRAMQCPNEWVIIYHGSSFKPEEKYIRHIPLTYDPSKFTLPGKPYAGGIKYADTLNLINLHKQLYPTTPPPIVVDMPQE